MPNNQTTERSQEEILRRIAAGDSQAFGEFYDQAASLLFSVAARMLGDIQEAEEVIQDVFAQIWRKAGTFDPAIGLPLHWALGITRNRCLDRIRSRKRKSQLLEELQNQADPPDASPMQHSNSSLRGEDELAAVRAALGSLPPEQCEAIQLAFFAGLTHLQIAQQINQPLGTIKARIRRGMLKLREDLKQFL